MLGIKLIIAFIFSVFELPTVTLIPNGIHHSPIEDGRLLPNSVKNSKLNRLRAFLPASYTLTAFGHILREAEPSGATR